LICLPISSKIRSYWRLVDEALVIPFPEMLIDFSFLLVDKTSSIYSILSGRISFQLISKCWMFLLWLINSTNKETFMSNLTLTSSNFRRKHRFRILTSSSCVIWEEILQWEMRRLSRFSGLFLANNLVNLSTDNVSNSFSWIIKLLKFVYLLSPYNIGLIISADKQLYSS
jgi:hypothetical protein